MKLFAKCTLLFVFTISLAASLASAQSTASNSSTALGILQRSLAAMAPSAAVADAKLEGTARYTAGSGDESGPAVLEAAGTSESRVTLSLTSGQRLEIRSDGQGAWATGDGVEHAMALHNCWAPGNWFAPAALLRGLIAGGYTLSYSGREEIGGAAVEHIVSSAPAGAQSGGESAVIQQLSSLDIYLDAATYLPSALKFNLHPDGDYTRSIPVEVRFGDYRLVNGVNIPFHIQRYLNRTLQLDFSASGAALNSGLPPSDFQTSAD